MESDFYECPPRSVFDDENGEFCLWLLVHMSKMAAAHSMPQVNKNLSSMFFIISKWFLDSLELFKMKYTLYMHSGISHELDKVCM